MSRESERKRMREAMAAYTLLTTAEVAHIIRRSPETARARMKKGTLKCVRIGGDYLMDPLDLAVHILAEREGVSFEEFWEAHEENDEIVDLTRAMIRRWRKLDAA